MSNKFDDSTKGANSNDELVAALKRVQLLEFYLKAALEYIDAVPKETADSLPAMPGFDRDVVNSLLKNPTQPPRFSNKF